MSSSTSNSEKYWILWSMLVCAICCGAYTLALELPMFRYGGGQGSSELQNCIIRAERYLFDLRQPVVVITGSSKAGRIRADLMDVPTYALSAPCLGSQGGIDVVLRKAVAPQLLLVELNNLGASSPTAIGPALTQEVNLEALPFPVRHWFKIFRQEYNLFLVAKTVIYPLLGLSDRDRIWFLPPRVDLTTGQLMASPEGPLSKQIQNITAAYTTLNARGEPPYSQGVLDLIKSYSNELQGIPLEAIQGNAGSFLRYFQATEKSLAAKGGHIGFIRLPEPPMIEQTHERQTIAQKIHEQMPEAFFFASAFPFFEISDAAHMEENSSMIYTSELQAAVQKYLGMSQNFSGKDRPPATGL